MRPQRAGTPGKGRPHGLKPMRATSRLSLPDPGSWARMTTVTDAC